MARRIEVSQNELLAAIRQAREPDYPNAMTMGEIMVALAMTRTQVRTVLAKLDVECVRIRRTDRTGRLNVVTAYLLR